MMSTPPMIAKQRDHDLAAREVRLAQIDLPAAP